MITNDTTKKIWAYLIRAGLTPEGAAGLMGNLFAESGCIPNRVEILCLKRLRDVGRYYTDATYTALVDDDTISRAEFLNPLPGKVYGYGIAQWTVPSRKAALYDRCKANYKSIGDLETQLDYLMHELKTVFQYVHKVLTSAQTIREASDTVLRQFECPADVSDSVQMERYNYAKQFYDAYAGGNKVSKGITAEMIINIIRQWVGWSEGDGRYRKIIDIYNAYRPLARGYKVQYTDAWCDTTVSAAFITAGDPSIIGGTECGVQEHIQLFKAAGIWKGRVMPEAGDLITYDWHGDGYADHIGVVEQVKNGVVVTIEGNYQDSVKRRVIAYNNPQICGYARPKYGEYEPVIDKEITATEPAEKFDAKIAGTYRVTKDANMRNGAGSAKYSVMVKIPKNTKVQNYGYYSVNGAARWLYMQVKIGDVTYTGFVSAGLVKKI